MVNYINTPVPTVTLILRHNLRAHSYGQSISLYLTSHCPFPLFPRFPSSSILLQISLFPHLRARSIFNCKISWSQILCFAALFVALLLLWSLHCPSCFRFNFARDLSPFAASVWIQFCFSSAVANSYGGLRNFIVTEVFLVFFEFVSCLLD